MQLMFLHTNNKACTKKIVRFIIRIAQEMLDVAAVCKEQIKKYK